MAEDIDYLSEKEFKELLEKDKWNFVEILKKKIEALQIKADKNCAECEKNYLTVDDINIELFFEDWRACADHCDECSDEERVHMCDLQFQLINHIANALLEVQRKQNMLTQIVLKRDETGSTLLKEFYKEKEEIKKKDKHGKHGKDDMYL